MIDSGPALTKDHEGYSPIYLDSMGYPTQGYGSLLRKKAYKTLKEYHEELFEEQYIQFVREYESLGFDLDPIRRAAIIDILYARGLKNCMRLESKSFFDAIRMKDWLKASSELAQWPWFQRVGRRGPRLQKLITNGRWDVL